MDQATGDRIAVEFGFTPEKVQALRSMPFEKAVPALDEMKKEARSRYKKLVFKYHPDRNPDDPGATARLSNLSTILKHIEALSVRPAPQQAPMQVSYVQWTPQGPVMRQQVYVRTAPTYSSSTVTTYTATYMATRVANIRPV